MSAILEPRARRRRKPTAEEYADRQSARRQARSLEVLGDTLDRAAVEIPPAVTEIVRRRGGTKPLLSAAAFELARQVYFEHRGSMRDAARAIIEAGLSDTPDVDRVAGRLKVWWQREGWPRHETLDVFAIRDANHDGGLYRGRLCAGTTTGSGPAPEGKACGLSALSDSRFCAGHDPRPEYADFRARQGERLAASREADLVPVEPLLAWMDCERQLLLTEARRCRRVHPNNRGWGLLATAMGCDASVVARLFRTKSTSTRRGQRQGMLRASTVVSYLEHAGVEFREVYGFDPPARRRGDDYRVCAGCGGPKNPASELCRSCHERQGARCAYVNRRGARCPVSTSHPSGYCHKCRRIVERVPRPRTGRRSFVSVPMLILATEAYLECDRLAWVARRMWAADTAGVRSTFAGRRSLESALVKQFRKRGWTTADVVRAAHEDLVLEHGTVGWPAGDHAPLEAAGVVPAAPFYRWLGARYAELGSYAKLSRRLGLSADRLSRVLRGVDVPSTVRRAMVDEALEAWGDGTRFADVYEVAR